MIPILVVGFVMFALAGLVIRKKGMSSKIDLTPTQEIPVKGVGQQPAEDENPQDQTDWSLSSLWEETKKFLHRRWKDRGLHMVAGWIFLYLLCWMIVGRIPSPTVKEYASDVLGSGGFFFLALGAAIFALMRKKDSAKPFIEKFGDVGLKLVILAGIVYFGMGIYAKVEKEKVKSNPTDASKKPSAVLTSIPEPAPLLPFNQTGKAVVEKFFTENLPDKPEDAAQFVRIAGRESNFNQHELDGKKVYTRRPTLSDPRTCMVGILQINTCVWEKKIKELGAEYDVRTMEGNLRFGLWLYHHRGDTFQDWPATRDKGSEMLATAKIENSAASTVTKVVHPANLVFTGPGVYKVVIPGDQQWYPVKVPEGYKRFQWMPRGNVLVVRDENWSDAYEDGPKVEGNLKLGIAKILHFKTMTGESVIIEFTLT